MLLIELKKQLEIAGVNVRCVTSNHNHNESHCQSTATGKMRTESDVRKIIAAARDGMPFDIACVTFLSIDVKLIAEIYELTNEAREQSLQDAGKKKSENHDVQERLGLILMIERKKAELTQRQCASKFNVSESAWGNAEKGRNVSIERLLELIGMINMAALPQAVEIANKDKVK